MKRKGWPLIIDDTTIVRSAGGIVSRIVKSEFQVLIIHRTRHNDWSFPKGRLEPNESFETAAIREVIEETGYLCRLEKPLPTIRYIDRDGHPKEVRYWNMTVVSESLFTPNDEVDQIEWLSLFQTIKKLSYKTDRILLKRAFA